MATSDKDLHADAMKAYNLAIEVDSHNRSAFLEDVRFARLGEQWPPEVQRQREIDGRPCLTLNRLPAFIRQVTNDARQNKPSIKFHAVGDGADTDTAKILDGLVRNIEYTSNADVAYDTALDNAVTGSFGYFRISTDYTSEDSFDQDIKIERIANPLSVVGDPYCFDADSANWNTCFVEEPMPIEEFKKKWPKASVSNFESDNKNTPPAGWIEENIVKVAEWWTREEVPTTLLLLSNGMVMDQAQYDGAKDLLEASQITVQNTRQSTRMKVTQRIISGAEILEANDWAGKYIPIVPVYGDEVIIDGKRHLISLIRFAKDPQQMLNYWRTVSTELVALAPKAPWIGPKGAFNSDQNWATANTVTHAYLEYDGQTPPQRNFFDGPPAGALQEAINASDDMKSIMGLFDASLGAQSNETSGRAILARQREGDVSTFNFTDNLARAIRHAGRILVDLIPKVYSSARMIRVIDPDGANRNVPINGMQPPPPSPQEQEEQAEQKAGMLRIFDLTAGKYDVTCEVGPSYTTQREEAAEQMIQFMQVYPAAAPLLGDLLAKNLDWPGAEEISDRLKAMLPPQVQGQNPQMQQAQQTIQQLQQALQQCQKQLEDAARDKSIDAAKVDVDKQKTQISAYDAETKRMQTLGLQASPQLAAALGMQVAQSALTAPDITPSEQGQTQQQPAPQMPVTPPQPDQPAPMPQPAAPPQGF